MTLDDSAQGYATKIQTLESFTLKTAIWGPFSTAVKNSPENDWNIKHANVVSVCLQCIALCQSHISCIFTARRYASAVYAVVVCLSVRLSYAGIVPKRLVARSRKQRHTIAQGLFSDAKDLGEIPTMSPQRGRQIEVGRFKSAVFD